MARLRRWPPRARGVDAKDVDQVFLTGGSSFVPAVRRIFEERFGRRTSARAER